MTTKFQIDNIVKYPFWGNASQYRIIATKEQPYIRKNIPSCFVQEGYDYYIIPTEINGPTDFVSVLEADIELIK